VARTEQYIGCCVDNERWSVGIASSAIRSKIGVEGCSEKEIYMHSNQSVTLIEKAGGIDPLWFQNVLWLKSTGIGQRLLLIVYSVFVAAGLKSRIKITEICSQNLSESVDPVSIWNPGS